MRSWLASPSANWVLGMCMLLGALSGAPRAQTGLVPLNDLGPSLYEGFPGGLYPGGVNHPPVAHFQDALQKAAQIVPRNAAGAPDPQGFIGMIAVGMSNTTHEFGAFERNEDANRLRNARVVIVDTGLGGQTAATISNPAAAYWTTMMQRLTAMGLTASQVQVAWFKEADGHPPDNFPVHAQTLRDEFELIANNLHDKFPNLAICYVSSRIYGGYASPGTLNPEPQAYESGFAVKWLIEDQIGGDPGLNHGQIDGPVRAPLLLWGPYLWADGTNPRSDGLVWLSTDLEADHTHPSADGEQKVAGLLSSFFARDATAAPWWPARGGAGLVAVDAIKDAYVSAASPGANFGSALDLRAQGGAQPLVTYAGFDLTAAVRPVALAKLSMRVTSSATGGGRISAVSDTSWGESTITFTNAPPLGSALVNMPQSTRDGTIGANVTGNVNADADGLATFDHSSTAAGLSAYHSREDQQPPRLVLTAPCAGWPDGDGDGRTDPCDCAPLDPGSHSLPVEVAGLRWSAPGTLAWNPQGGSAGSGTVHDLMSGDFSEVANFGARSLDLCVASGVPGGTAADATPMPAAGGGRFFLVRARNACAASRWETSSDGRDRAATCP